MQRLTSRVGAICLLILFADASLCLHACDMKVYLPSQEGTSTPSHAYLLSPATNADAIDTSPTKVSQPLSVDAFADLLAQSMGFHSTDAKISSQIPSLFSPKYGLWNRPRALALIHLDGVSTEALSSNPSSKLASILLSAHVKFELSPDSHVRDAVDRTADLLRLSTEEGHIATKLSKLIPNSLIYGGSPQSKFMATVLSKSVHERLSKIHIKLPSTYERLSEEFDDSLLLKAFQEIGVKAERIGNKISFHVSSHHTTNEEESFDLGDLIDHTFLSKIEYALSLAANLANDQYKTGLSDNAPDLFVFDLSVPSQEMSAQPSSTLTRKTLVAWNLVGHTVEKITSILGQQYGEDYMPILHASRANPTTVMTETVKVSLAKSIGKGLDTSIPIDSLLPCVPFKNSITSKQKSRLCHRIQSRIRTQDIHVDCPVYSGRIPVFSKSLTALKQSNSTTEPTDDEIVLYQISFWTGVALLVATFATVSGLAFMSVRYDTLLYFPSTSRAKME